MELISHRKHNVNLSRVERAASVIAGTAVAFLGLRKPSPAGLALAVIGGEAIRRGATGHSYLYEAFGVRTADKGQGAETTSLPYELGIRVEKTITVNRPRADVYRFWRDIENLPRFMKHLECVKKIDDQTSHWVVQAPAGRKIEWDARVHNDVENELLAWRSLEGSQVDNAGSVTFKDAPGGGTEVRVLLQYNPPAGILGAMFAKLFCQEPSQQIHEDLRRFKQLMETGEIPTTQGQPSGREMKSGGEGAAQREKKSADVHEASEMSFPASDAPAYSH